MMIRKIICPTDFSNAALNGISYAAKVAQLFSAELTLLNVRSRLSSILGPSTDTVLQYSDETLKDVCAEISRAYKISCAETVELTDQPVEVAIQIEADPDTIIVMGSNGVNNLSELLFGSHAYRIVETSGRPVWIVPENYEYGSIQKMVIAFTESEDISTLEQLHPFLEVMHPAINVLTFSDKLPTSERVEQLKGQLRKYLTSPVITNQYIAKHRAPKAIVEFSNKLKADLLVLTYETENFVFSNDIVRSILNEPLIPILILPDNNRKVA